MKHMSEEKMRMLADVIKNAMPGFGFVLVTCPWKKEGQGLSSYITNARKNDMVSILEEIVVAMKKNEDTDPNMN